MSLKYHPEIRLNQFGHPDVDFYISEAKRLRREAISLLLHDILGRLKKPFSKGENLPMRAAH
jgi:hypothetical protein